MERDVKKMSTWVILKNNNGMIVIYWPSTEPSIKRCTCVNKWKNSGSRWTLENNITRCLGGSSQLETGWQRENQLAALSDPRLSTPAKVRKKFCYGRGRTWVNIAVCPCLQLISHTQQTSPWELIFIYCGLFVLILVVFCVVSSFTTCRPDFTSGLLQVIYRDLG